MAASSCGFGVRRRAVCSGISRTGLPRGQGWTEGRLLLSLCLPNILGYECAEDLDRMEADEGLCVLVRRHERRKLGHSRRQLENRHREGRRRTFPSPRSLLDWLHAQHDEAAARERRKGSAHVPAPSASLLPMQEASRRLVSLVAEEVGLQQATVDIDATIIGSCREEALPTCRSANGTRPGERGYQPLNRFLAELGMMLCSEMRDGNVPAREGNARVLAEALTRLPETVREVTVRSDSAGHSVDVIRFCNRPELRPEATRRFGVVGFAISAVRSVELMAAVEATPEAAWKPLRRLEKRTAEGEGSPAYVEVEADGEALRR